jgi:hypothetical protein
MVGLLLKLALRQQDFLKCWVLSFAFPLFLYDFGEFSIFLSGFTFPIFLNPAHKPKFYGLLYQLTNAPTRKILLIGNLLLVSFISIVFISLYCFGWLAKQILEIPSLTFPTVSFIHQFFIVIMTLLGGLSVANIIHRVDFKELNWLMTFLVSYSFILGLMIGIFFILRMHASENLIFSLVCVCVVIAWLLSIKFYNFLAR